LLSVFFLTILVVITIVFVVSNIIGVLISYYIYKFIAK
jgi:uncharacterized membrane protein